MTLTKRNSSIKAAVIAALFVCALTACGGGLSETPRQEYPGQELSGDGPRRIVSLDYCADQYVLKFATRGSILAISPDATKDFSYMRDAAIGVPTVRPIAENVIILKPDLVVRTYGGGPNATAFFERAGVPVLNVGWTNTIDDVIKNIDRVASELGAQREGQAVIAGMRARLAAFADAGADANQKPLALYMTPAGVTTGAGSLVHEIMAAAGLSNFQEQRGWRSLPLERLAYEQPDLVAASFFETLTNHPDAWSPAKHPVAKSQLGGSNVAALDGAWTACGGWFLLEAVEALAEAAGR
ncbi:MAG: ABC transporter substrate-binding protein [Pseudomonadota bacterium]